MTWVKICGTTSLADAQMSVAAGADALGFIFAASPRQIDADAAAEIVKAVSGEVETIGVFVNESPSSGRGDRPPGWPVRSTVTWRRDSPNSWRNFVENWPSQNY